MLRKTRTSISVLVLAVMLALGTIQVTPAWASDPFVAQIKIFPYNFAPRGWAFCNGDLLPIAENTALFSLVGTTYGGDGRTTLGLPDLRGRFAMHAGRGPGLSERRLGEKGGVEQVRLTEAQIPSHRHQLNAHKSQGRQDAPNNNVLAYDRREDQYSTEAPDVDMNSAAIGSAGGGWAHNNMPPYLGFNYCIALWGLYPSRS